MVELGSYSEAQMQRLHRNGPETEIEYRLAWPRTYLKAGGAIDNSRRGVWSLLEKDGVFARKTFLPSSRAIAREFDSRVSPQARLNPKMPRHGRSNSSKLS